MLIHKKYLWLLLVHFLLCTNLAIAQQVSQFHVADTSSPRDTLRSFIDACNELHDLIQANPYIERNSNEHHDLVLKILDCLDTSKLPPFAREQSAAEAAAALKEILDRVKLPPWDKIPDAKEIQAAGGYERLTRWRIPDTRITIERVEEGPQKHEYLFSTGTVERALEYYQRIAHRPYRTEEPKTSPGLYNWYVFAPGKPFLGTIVAQFPEKMRFGRTWGLVNWKWPGVIVLLIVAVLLMWMFYRLYFSISKRVFGKSVVKYCLTLVFPICAMLVPIAFAYIMEHYLTVRSTPLYVIFLFSDILAILAAVVVCFGASTRIAETIIASPNINPMGLNAQLIRISSKLTSMLVILALLLIGGQYLGIPIATLLASAGIGGIALALGAQDTLKTLFATIAIMADKPCRVGDRIVIDEYDGYVEDIGLRSTKLRLLDGHLVTLPNDLLANREVDNVSSRTSIRRDAEIHIPLDTSCAEVEKAVAIVRENLAGHKEINSELLPKVFLNDLGPEVFRIRFIYWYSPPNYWEFKTFGGKLNFEIFREFEDNGIQFSLPLRYSYWKQDTEQGPLEIQLVDNNPIESKPEPLEQKLT